jgi:hypothetical protein
LTHRIALGALPGVLAQLCQASELGGGEYLKAVVDCEADGDWVQVLAAAVAT